jgi:cysteine desulfurase/selenocysteine lyase
MAEVEALFSPSDKMMAENSWRDDFPALSATMNGQKLVYLDSASSAQKPQQVIDALTNAVKDNYANIHRGLYRYSQVKTEEFEAVRGKVARFIGASNSNTIVFTRNSTEAINLISQSWGRNTLKSGDEVILSGMEHHANIVPWQLLRDQLGIVIKVIPVLDDGTLDLDAFKSLLSPKTRLVGLVHISNAIGTLNDASKIKDIIVSFNSEIKLLVDGSQSVVHRPVHISDFDPDFFVFTGHKLYGPTGVGVLYGKYDLLNSMPPYQGGGDMIERVTFEHTTYKDAPARFEAGTPPIAEVIALGAAIDYVSAIGMDRIAAHEQSLLSYATDRLISVPGLRIYGTAPDKAGIISFTLEGIHSSDIAMVLDRMGIAVRTGHHCCMPLMQRFGIEGTVRASFGLYSSHFDIDRLCEGLDKVRELMG